MEPVGSALQHLRRHVRDLRSRFYFREESFIPAVPGGYLPLYGYELGFNRGVRDVPSRR